MSRALNTISVMSPTPADDRPGNPLLSVVLCTRNGSSTISDQLAALRAQDARFAWEVVVVDNGSTDDTVDVVSRTDLGRTPLRVVDAGNRRGLSYARNRGTAAAIADRIAFCDDDDVVGEGWVSAMNGALADHPLVASAIEYELLNPSELLIGRARFQSTGIESLFGMPVCAGACGVQRSLWDALGGNDERLTDTGEDFDFALRAFSVSGVRPFFEPAAVYHHRLRSDTGHVFAQARAHGRSHAALWRRHGSGRVAPRPDLRFAMAEWWWLITRSPLAAAGRNRMIWLRRLGRRVGRAEGSLRHRVVVP